MNHNADGLRKKRLRCAVLAGTLAHLRGLQVKGSSSMYEKPTVYVPDHAEEGGSVVVVAGDCLNTAQCVSEKFKKVPYCLVMSSRAHLGGGYKNGAAAQEEHIYRSSSISFLHADGAQHPKETSLTVFKNVAVCRGSEMEGYPFRSIYRVNLISMAAVADPSIEIRNGKEIMDKKSYQLMDEKIKVLLGHIDHNSHVVLGAWGCGVYNLPPEQVHLFVCFVFVCFFCFFFRLLSCSRSICGIESCMYILPFWTRGPNRSGISKRLSECFKHRESSAFPNLSVSKLPKRF
jgi:uncharacterized protein (TIGR02452 family)